MQFLSILETIAYTSQLPFPKKMKPEDTMLGGTGPSRTSGACPTFPTKVTFKFFNYQGEGCEPPPGFGIDTERRTIVPWLKIVSATQPSWLRCNQWLNRQSDT